MFPIDYDAALNAWTIRHTATTLSDDEEMDAFERFMNEHVIPKFSGEKVVLFIDVTGLEIGAKVADRYGAFARAFVEAHAQTVFRYGEPAGMTQSVIQLQAVIRHFPSNLYADRRAALRALELYRQEQASLP